MTDRKFASVWDAVEDTPEQAEHMKELSALMIVLVQHIETAGLTHTEAANLFGVPEPRIADLLRGKINLFTMDKLIDMARSAGLHSK